MLRFRVAWLKGVYICHFGRYCQIPFNVGHAILFYLRGMGEDLYKQSVFSALQTKCLVCHLDFCSHDRERAGWASCILRATCISFLANWESMSLLTFSIWVLHSFLIFKSSLCLVGHLSFAFVYVVFSYAEAYYF